MILNVILNKNTGNKKKLFTKLVLNPPGVQANAISLIYFN